MPLLDHPVGDLEYVIHEGDPGRPTAVFLHEGLGSTGQWGRLPALFARQTGLRVLVYSRHGYGGSVGHGPDGPRYLHTQALEILPRVLTDLSIDAPYLVGHSDGASIAAIYASEHPVLGATLIAPHIVVEEATLAGIRSTAASFGDTVRPSLAMFHDDPDRLFERWSTVWLSDEFADFDITDAVARIHAPLQVIQGADDNYATDLQLDRISERAPDGAATHLLAGHGHHPHLTDPDGISTLISDFVRDTVLV
ncbi:alpha/beta fold hydrolase [Gordonia soli]|uniref:AB hydrolase-1 domain-containing protein n=1 Tax=Gordonia soli NBRC 108243 TaxID=1223545 RepID=M0QQX0_9ACTN|nr:alpha/beta hydrolase [Gordonia soli]GAC70666.1 hypothetical protein GS4_38_00730 [Gordonia soli NBRC 108243]